MNADDRIFEEDLHAYVDNVLDAARRREVQDYLDRHPETALKVERLMRQRQALRSALAGVAREPIPPELNLARLMSGQRTHARRPWRLAATVLLAFGLGGAGGWALRGNPAPAGGIDALAHEAASSYEYYASDSSHPVEINAEHRAELTTWVTNRLRRKLAAPDLTGAGYRFMGGRLVATAHGPAALFIYDNAQGARMAMLVRPMALERDSPMVKHAQGDVAGYTWADQGLGYSLVASQPAVTLHPLADEMRRQTGGRVRG